MSTNAGLAAPYDREQGHLMIWPPEHRYRWAGGGCIGWRDQCREILSQVASSITMTGACLTVSQVQSIRWSAAPSSTWLLLVTSAFVTPIVTRGDAARPCAIRAAAVTEAPAFFLDV